MIELDKKTIALIQKHEKAQEKLRSLGVKIGDVFRPIVDSTFHSKGKDAAIEVVNKMPCCIERAFMLDRIRYILPKSAKTKSV